MSIPINMSIPKKFLIPDQTPQFQLQQHIDTISSYKESLQATRQKFFKQ